MSVLEFWRRDKKRARLDAEDDIGSEGGANDALQLQPESVQELLEPKVLDEDDVQEREPAEKEAPGPTDLSESRHGPPCQPVLKSYPRGKDGRCFQASWYTGRDWLEFSQVVGKMFCRYCRFFRARGRMIRISVSRKLWQQPRVE